MLEHHLKFFLLHSSLPSLNLCLSDEIYIAISWSIHSNSCLFVDEREKETMYFQEIIIPGINYWNNSIEERLLNLQVLCRVSFIHYDPYLKRNFEIIMASTHEHQLYKFYLSSQEVLLALLHFFSIMGISSLLFPVFFTQLSHH